MISINLTFMRSIHLFTKSKAFRLLIIVMQSILGLVLFRWVLLNAGLTFNQLFVEFVDVSPIPLVLGVLFFLLTIGLRALRFKLFLSQAVSSTYIYGISLIQNAFITFVPWRIGEVSYPILLNKDFKESIKKSTATIFIVRTMDFLLS